MTLLERTETAAALPETFRRWFAARGWSPRAHQLELLAKARAGRSALLIAPTGAGKTLAGFLPTLVELSAASSRTRPAPSPLVGEGWGGGYEAKSERATLPPSRLAPLGDLPRKGGGEERMRGEGSQRKLISTGRDLRREGGLHTLYISPLKALAVDIARNLERPVEEMASADPHRNADGRHPGVQAPAPASRSAPHPPHHARAACAHPRNSRRAVSVRKLAPRRARRVACARHLKTRRLALTGAGAAVRACAPTHHRRSIGHGGDTGRPAPLSGAAA